MFIAQKPATASARSKRAPCSGSLASVLRREEVCLVADAAQRADQVGGAAPSCCHLTATRFVDRLTRAALDARQLARARLPPPRCRRRNAAAAPKGRLGTPSPESRLARCQISSASELAPWPQSAGRMHSGPGAQQRHGQLSACHGSVGMPCGMAQQREDDDEAEEAR